MVPYIHQSNYNPVSGENEGQEKNQTKSIWQSSQQLLRYLSQLTTKHHKLICELTFERLKFSRQRHHVALKTINSLERCIQRP